MTHLHRRPPSTTARPRPSITPTTPAMPKKNNNPLPHPPRPTPPALWDTRTNDGGLVGSTDPPKSYFYFVTHCFCPLTRDPPSPPLDAPWPSRLTDGRPTPPWGCEPCASCFPRPPLGCHYPLITALLLAVLPAGCRPQAPASPGVPLGICPLAACPLGLATYSTVPAAVL